MFNTPAEFRLMQSSNDSCCTARLYNTVDLEPSLDLVILSYHLHRMIRELTILSLLLEITFEVAICVEECPIAKVTTDLEVMQCNLARLDILK
jgi:hypothetical protein